MPTRTKKAGQTRMGTERLLETSDEAIRRRAYQIYESRGGTPGREMDDWVQAERELRRPGDR